MCGASQCTGSFRAASHLILTLILPLPESQVRKRRLREAGPRPHCEWEKGTLLLASRAVPAGVSLVQRGRDSPPAPWGRARGAGCRGSRRRGKGVVWGEDGSLSLTPSIHTASHPALHPPGSFPTTPIHLAVANGTAQVPPNEASVILHPRAQCLLLHHLSPCPTLCEFPASDSWCVLSPCPVINRFLP